MKCPLLQRYLIEGENEALEVFDDCLREKCGWWDDGVEQCGFLTASLALRGMLALLGQLADKMPHEEQFRR